MTTHPFTGVIQDYAWGGSDYLASLLSRVTADGTPKAEYWMGAHHKGPAKLTHLPGTLAELIERDPKATLGGAVADRFDNRLPFLFKVLDVKDMLSIQVHPDKRAAEEGFAREEQSGPDRLRPQS